VGFGERCFRPTRSNSGLPRSVPQMRGANVGYRPKPEHDTFAWFMEADIDILARRCAI
jgi:hypothetical protein